MIKKKNYILLIISGVLYTFWTHSMEVRTDYFELLPNEIIYLIWQQLDIKSTYCLGITCKHTYSLFQKDRSVRKEELRKILHHYIESSLSTATPPFKVKSTIGSQRQAEFNASLA